MGNYQWYMTGSRQELLKKLKELPDYSEKDVSELLEMAIQEFVKNHAKGNPAFQLDAFQDPAFKAFPTLGADPEKYFQESDAVEVSEVRARLDVWKLAVARRESRELVSQELADQVEACPYCSMTIPKFMFRSHLWSQHKDQAVKDGRLASEWSTLTDARGLF